MKTFASFASVAVILLAFSCSVFAEDHHVIEQQVRSVLQKFQSKHNLPGLTASLVLADGKIVNAAVGLADKENNIPMTIETRMLAASIGKTFVGALVLSLESEDVFERDDLVAEYLSHHDWYSRLPNHATITIDHLLKHQSGLPDHVHLEGIGPKLIQLGLSDNFEPKSVVELVLDQPAQFEAGTAWSYSDTGYVVLGLVIEEAAKRRFYDLVQEHLLHPLELKDTTPSNTRSLVRLAVGYTEERNAFDLPVRNMDENGELVWNPAIEWTGGGFASTSQDLARWGHLLFGGQALEYQYLDQLLDGVAVHPDAPGVLYGAGVAVYSETKNGPVYGHGGWIPGYVSSLRHYADSEITIAFQVNSDVGIPDDSANFVPALEAELIELMSREM